VKKPITSALNIFFKRKKSRKCIAISIYECETQISAKLMVIYQIYEYCIQQDRNLFSNKQVIASMQIKNFSNLSLSVYNYIFRIIPFFNLKKGI